MSTITEKAKEEFLLILPPTAFFFVALHIVALIRSLMSKGEGIPISSTVSIAVAALILGKAVLLADMLPLINRYPDRFIFGTDEVAPSDQTKYLKVYTQYAPLFAQLTPEASQNVRLKNYERLFDEARRKVRAWEKANMKETTR